MSRKVKELDPYIKARVGEAFLKLEGLLKPSNPSGTTAITDFADTTWSTSTITARGAMIYNSTQSNKSVAILDFGSDKSSSSGDFTVQFPTPDATNAIIRIV